MGTLTLDEFRDEVRLVCGGIESGNSVWTDDRIDRRINASYLWVAMPNHFRHPELEQTDFITLLANTDNYTFSLITFNMIYGVEHIHGTLAEWLADPAGTRHTKLDPKDYRELMDMRRTARPPAEYALWGNDRIYLTGVPDTNSVGQLLAVHGYIQPGILALPTATTQIKAEWDEVIVLGAEWRMWLSMNEHDRAYEAKQNYAQMVNEVANFNKLHGEEWGWQNADAGEGLMMRSD